MLTLEIFEGCVQFDAFFGKLEQIVRRQLLTTPDKQNSSTLLNSQCWRRCVNLSIITDLLRRFARCSLYIRNIRC